jgi:hypothetical protein
VTDPAPTGGDTAAPVPPSDAVTAPATTSPDALPDGVPSADAAEDETAAPPPGLWDRMRDDPQYAPEHLALEAVRRLGPEARDWVQRVRSQRPAIPPDELAELAIRRFVARARLSGAVSGAAGLPGAILDVGVLAWTQARMVLHIAAAYGLDPEQADRATDLLVLQRVHKVAESARLALGVAAGRERAATVFQRSNTPLRQALLRLSVKLAQMAGIRAAKRIFAKIVPGAAIILGTWANSSATNDLARRAQSMYRPRAIEAKPAPKQR